MPEWEQGLSDQGFILASGVYSPEQARVMADQLGEAFTKDPNGGSLRSQGKLYGARNVLAMCPWAATVWREKTLLDMFKKSLGPNFGLVRILYFDKPPGLSWSLPWHKDLTIAVQDNHLPSYHFTHPTRKAGVPHVEAPEDLLADMLTARIHLDDITEENGPMWVLPGSHRHGKTMPAAFEGATPVLARRGDVLVIRPLVAHSSEEARPITEMHRRVLHLEFASTPNLADGYAWHDFVPGVTMAKRK